MNNVYFLNTNNKFINKNKLKLKNFNFNILNYDNIKNIKLNKNDKLYEDYVRISIAYKNGGLILDGNIKIVDNIDLFFNNDIFLGYSIENKIATNILWSKSKKNIYLKNILTEIENNPNGDITDIFSKILGRRLDSVYNSLVVIDKKIYIYPYDYFYPIDYTNCGKQFSENTKIIFFENKKMAVREKIKLNIFLKFGNSSYKYLSDMKDVLRFKVASKKYKIQQKLGIVSGKENIKDSLNLLKKYQGKNINYIIIHNPNWMGVTAATKELFKNLLPLEELYNERDINNIANLICSLNLNQVIFSAFADGWDKLARRIKEINKDIKIKVFWHGSNSQVIETINWRTNVLALNLHKEGIIDVFATCKESLLNFYKSQGYNAVFIKNTVNLNKSLKCEILKNKLDKKNEKIKVGLYAANMDWRKNMFNQIAAISLIENSCIYSVPLNFEGKVFASKLGIDIFGENKTLKREELLKKMAQNDINLYVTFSECAPMLPIESMEVGVICISGNNHHYFKGTELEKYLVIDREDDVLAISNKIKFALDNKDKIFELYEKWKYKYDLESKKSVQEFLEM